MYDASLLAYLALLLPIPLAVFAFAMWPPTKAACVVFFGSLLFLPERIALKIPVLPPLGKEQMALVCILIALISTARHKLSEAKLGRGLDIFLLIVLLGIYGTVRTNPDPLVFGRVMIPALSSGDLVSMIAREAFSFALPFIVGRAVFRTESDLRLLLTALVWCGVAYFPLILFELRFSPQLHRMLYGFHQHDFGQQVRNGGYRPMVFMGHGLVVAMLVWQSLVAGWALKRLGQPIGALPASLVAGTLTLLMPVLKSVAPIIYAVVCIPLVLLTRGKTMARVAVVAATIVAAYPILSIYDAFPKQELVDYAARYSQDRAQSLDYRFQNERSFIQKALQRPIFGWGGYDRGNIFNEEGRAQGVWDGAWIIMFSFSGWVGLLSRFAVILLPIFIAMRKMGKFSSEIQLQLGTLTLILGIMSLDLLPNGMPNGTILFLGGGLIGVLQGMRPRKRNLPQLLRALLRLNTLQPRAPINPIR